MVVAPHGPPSWAISSVVERFLHTEEVAGSSPASPTSLPPAAPCRRKQVTGNWKQVPASLRRAPSSFQFLVSNFAARYTGPMPVPEPQSRQLTGLVKLLELDRLDQDLFVGSPGRGEGRLFGGLVAAQCVIAAHRTVEEGALHSLHAYFLRPGSHEVPIRYVVYRIRDGRTFTTRNVVAYQAGEAIFNLSCSFTKPEEGPSHQGPMPDAPDPERLPEWDFVRPDREERERFMRWRRERPIYIRLCDKEGTVLVNGVPTRRTWIKPKGVLPEDPAIHAAVLTYATDMGLLSTARQFTGAPNPGATASLDHAIWFHHPPRFADWLLYTSHSPIANAARALILGQMHRPDGTQVLSVAQEGLVRAPKPPPPTALS